MIYISFTKAKFSVVYSQNIKEKEAVKVQITKQVSTRLAINKMKLHQEPNKI
jgi:hypothetical protein